MALFHRGGDTEACTPTGLQRDQICGQVLRVTISRCQSTTQSCGRRYFPHWGELGSGLLKERGLERRWPEALLPQGRCRAQGPRGLSQLRTHQTSNHFKREEARTDGRGEKKAFSLFTAARHVFKGGEVSAFPPSSVLCPHDQAQWLDLTARGVPGSTSEMSGAGGSSLFHLEFHSVSRDV